MRGYLIADILELVASQFISLSWILTVAEDQDVAPVSLELGKLVVHVELLLLPIEDVDDNTNEHIQHEQGASHHVEHEEQDLCWATVLLWDFVDACCINGVPHDSNPALSGHHIEQCDQRGRDIVKVLIVIDPIASKVQAIEPILDFVDELIWHIRRLTSVKSSFIKVSSQDSKKQDKEQRNHHDIPNIWNGVDQRLDGNFHARVSADHPQWSQYSKHPQDFDWAKVDICKGNRDHRKENDDEVHDVPGATHVRIWSIQCKAIHHDLDQQLKEKDYAQDDVQLAHDCLFRAIRIFKWVFNRQQYC
jgi:hypothetical protein